MPEESVLVINAPRGTLGAPDGAQVTFCADDNSPTPEEGMISSDNPTISSDACFPPEGYKLPARLPVWDCASTAHIVTSADLLDDYHVSETPTTVSWGSADNSLNFVGWGTLLTRNHLPSGKTALMKFTYVLHVPGFGANLLSVKPITSS